MAVVQRPGVYVEEVLNPIQSIVGPNSNTVAAFVGPNDRGPLIPTLVTSWSDYVTKFGSWNTTASNDLPIGVFLYFQNGGSQAYVTRIVGASAAKATRTLSDRAGTPIPTLTLDAINEGTWGNNLNVSVTDSTIAGLFNIIVYFNGATSGDVVERFTDLSMDSTNARYAVSVINGSSLYITATDLASASTGATKNPAVITNQSLASGANGGSISASTYSSGLTLHNVIQNSLLVNLPGVTDANTVNTALGYASTRDDVFVVIDGKDDEVAEQLTLAASYTATSLGAVYYPRITISDPTVGLGGSSTATKLVGPGGAVMGLISRTDASRGVFKAPAGLQARIAGAVAVGPLTNAEYDALNTAAAPVNAIKFVSGSGIVVMGSRTLKQGYVDKYVPVRRTLIYLRKALIDLTQFAIFEPNDEALWRRLSASISSFLTQFWSQGGLRGASPAQAFFVKVDSTINPQSSIDNGIVNIEVGVALQRPAEFIVIKIGQYDGGTTVTVA